MLAGECTCGIKTLVIAKDNDGWASGNVYLKKENVSTEAGIEKRKFEPFSNRTLSNGVSVFFVPPGKYKLIMYHNNREEYPYSMELVAPAVDHDVITFVMDFTDGRSSYENKPRVQKE